VAKWQRVENLCYEQGSQNKELGYSTGSYMSVPLKIKDKVVGVLNLTDKKDDFSLMRMLRSLLTSHPSVPSP